MFKINYKFASKTSGFTLIELMITVAVIGILAAIALPNYTQYVQRSHRSNARNTLIQAAQWMERASNSTGAYPIDIPQPATPTVPPTPLSPIPTSLLAVEGMRYTVTVTNSAAATYTFNAIPTTVQASDPCGSLILTHTNSRTTLASDGTSARSAANIALQSDANCWQR